MKNNAITTNQSQGFALVATIAILSLGVMIAMAMVSLTDTSLKASTNVRYRELAKANARLGLAKAIASLQETMGRDQAVCAEASIFEVPNDPTNPDTKQTFENNRHWLGAWNTSVNIDNLEWPVVGKKADLGGNQPYLYKGIYSDLRNSREDLRNGSWRHNMRSRWLVSHGDNIDFRTRLDPTRGNAIELLGGGTLGAGLKNDHKDQYLRERVVVPLVDISEAGAEVGGKFGFWVTNNNLKAKIVQPISRSLDETTLNEVILSANPAVCKTVEGKSDLGQFQSQHSSSYEKMITDGSMQLLKNLTEQEESFLSEGFHDFSTSTEGLFIDVQHGGFKRDLTPLLLGKKNSPTITFEPPSSSIADFDFVSSDPIIAGERKAVIGPSFDALRNWGLKKYQSGLGSSKVQIENDFLDSKGGRYRSADGWERGISDGVAFESSQWGALAPKLKPIMVESRYHFYLSYRGSREKKNSNIRAHIIPRVSLWNPYNVTIEVPKMVVLMPNCFTDETGEGRFELCMKYSERSRLVDTYGSKDPREYSPLSGAITNLDAFRDWHGDRLYIKTRQKGRDVPAAEKDQTGVMPKGRYFGFELEPVTIQPGQCLVFSPSGKGGGGVPLSQNGVNIFEYSSEDISLNRLSAKVPQNFHHFYNDHDLEAMWVPFDYYKALVDENGVVRDDSGAPVFSDDPRDRQWGENRVPFSILNDVDMPKVYGYGFFSQNKETWIHLLKAANASTKNRSPDSLAQDTNQFPNNDQFPTLQIINSGNGGTTTAPNFFASRFWGDSHVFEFGDLETFEENPRKDAPRSHHIGSRLLWLDETFSEAASPPLRKTKWREKTHFAYNFPSIANGNVRADLISRSPITPCVDHWYATTSGGWLNNFNPHSPGSAVDRGKFTGTYYEKHPFADSNTFGNSRRVILFDLPDPNYGTLSLGNLRHAPLSPFSWHPTYIVGTSVADMHSPKELSANSLMENMYSDTDISNSFTYFSGGTIPYSLEWGAKTNTPTHDSLLQLGRHATSKIVDGKAIESTDENLTYDIAFEVNQNLWDKYFISGMPLSEDTENFDWSVGQPLFNDSYTFNHGTKQNIEEVKSGLQDQDNGLAEGFWLNGYYLKKEVSFNVNSTSVNAWAAYLAGLRNLSQKHRDNPNSLPDTTLFSRVKNPQHAILTGDVDLRQNAFSSGRMLSDEEVYLLAQCIVREVKLRGPFLSMADFVNRRLSNDAELSKWGAIEAAIVKSGINQKIESYRVDGSAQGSVNSEEDLPFSTTTDDSNLNNHPEWSPDLSRQVKSKLWGLSGHLNQGDILAPLAPILSVRGEIFTIRAYGQAMDSSGNVMAKAYLEAVVIRSPRFIKDDESGSTDSLSTPNIKQDTSSGALLHRNIENATNDKYGRKFIIQRMRWLSPEEV